MLTESMEDYLEMIYRIVEDRGYIRSVDLAEALDIQASSVTKMIQKLDRAGFVKYEKYRHIALTRQGEKYGEFLIWRDKKLKKFLELLSIQNNVEEQVEGIEHYITPETMCLIYSLIKFFHNNQKALQQVDRLQNTTTVPHREELDKLRARDCGHS
ncbi:MAG: transcriptional regulator MntR [Halanaerobiales bacterium]